MALNIKIIGILLLLGLTGGSALAVDHPACRGNDNNTCKTFKTMINLKGKLCYRVMEVESLGRDSFGITCEIASYDRSEHKYTFNFTNNMQSYEVY